MSLAEAFLTDTLVFLGNAYRMAIHPKARTLVPARAYECRSFFQGYSYSLSNANSRSKWCYGGAALRNGSSQRQPANMPADRRGR